MVSTSGGAPLKKMETANYKTIIETTQNFCVNVLIIQKNTTFVKRNCIFSQK